MSMTLALSICILFIAVMQLVNGAQYLIIIFFLLFAAAASAAAATAVFRTVIVALKSIYMQRYNHINLTLALKFYI